MGCVYSVLVLYSTSPSSHPSLTPMPSSFQVIPFTSCFVGLWRDTYRNMSNLPVTTNENFSPSSSNHCCLILYRSCVGSQSCSEFMGAAALLCPEDPTSQQSTRFSVSYNPSTFFSAVFPESWKWGGGWYRCRVGLTIPWSCICNSLLDNVYCNEGQELSWSIG